MSRAQEIRDAIEWFVEATYDMEGSKRRELVFDAAHEMAHILDQREKVEGQPAVVWGPPCFCGGDQSTGGHQHALSTGGNQAGGPQ